jgi:hypothetical protein
MKGRSWEQTISIGCRGPRAAPAKLLPLRPSLGDFRQGFAFVFRCAPEMVFRKAIAQELEGVFGGVNDFELVEVLRGNGPSIDKGLEVKDAVPVFAAVDDDQNFLGQLVGLRERENFEQFIHGAEAAGKDDKGLGEIGKPEFAHEEVVKLKVQRGSDVLVGALFEG